MTKTMSKRVKELPLPVPPYYRGRKKLLPGALTKELRSWGTPPPLGKLEKLSSEEAERLGALEREEAKRFPEREEAKRFPDMNVSYVFDEGAPARFAASRLKWLAFQLNLTQKEIARRVGVSPVVINRIFKDPDRSSVATLRKVAKAMGVKLIELIDER